MKTFYLTGIILLFGWTVSNAQSFHYDTIQTSKQAVYNQVLPSEPQTSSGFDKSKIEVGGSFGMVFGNYTSINIAPQIGYAFNKYFSAGGGISYNYFSYDYSSTYSRFKQTQNYLGLNVYGRLRPIPYIAFQVQPEGYYMWGNHDESFVVPTLLVGGGVVIPAGRGGISMMVYYDALQYKKNGINYSPYGDQLFYSVGYVFNF